MIIPQQLTLQQIKQSFRDVETKLNSLLVGNIDLRGRRVIGAGPSVSKFDYVTRLELDDVIGALPSADKSVTGPLNLVEFVRYGAFATRGAAIPHEREIFIASDHNNVMWYSTG